jgi:hypothetical protein
VQAAGPLDWQLRENSKGRGLRGGVGGGTAGRTSYERRAPKPMSARGSDVGAGGRGRGPREEEEAAGR